MLKRILLFSALLFGTALPLWAVLPDGVPRQPSEPITDQAGMLSAGLRERLNPVLRQAWAQGRGPQVAVLTLASLDGRPIEDVALSVARGWGLGGEASDNGVLLLIARNDRKLRIEVGTKLEGELTDVACQRIIADVMTPLLRQGDPDAAVENGVAHILNILAPGSSQALPPPARPRRTSSGIPLMAIVIIVVIAIILNVFMRATGLSSSRRDRWTSGGGWGSGGGFGGGGGGGGFSGGGGGFSGGGSSGGW